MKLRYFILLCAILASAYYLYLDEVLLSKFIDEVHEVAPELNQSTLYKWQDSKGEWQITDKPPSKGVSFTSITSQDQVNVMPTPSSTKKK